MLTRRNRKSVLGGGLSLSLWILILHMMAQPLFAQNFSGDARRIGLGAIGKGSTASKLIDDERPYSAIVIPFGLIQVLSDLDRFKTGDNQFDPVRIAEFAANPIHYTADRDAGDSGVALINDVVNGGLNRDLNTYRGFAPASELEAEGLIFFTFGHTVKLVEQENGFQGFYIGAGPYLAVDTTLNIDQQLIDILSSDVDLFFPNTTFNIRTLFREQLALATTFGYRARIGLPGLESQSDRDGLYLAIDYHYLHGFRHDDINAFDLNFDTDGAGLVTLAPTTTPLIVDRFWSESGRGFAIDVAVSGVSDRWEVGVDISGIANRIKWKNFRGERVELPSLTRALAAGFDFITTPLTPPNSTVEIKLPVNYGGNLAYSSPSWTALGEVSRGFQGTNFHAGLERRFGVIELRGGARHTRGTWHPTGGVGLNVLGPVSFDVAAFSTNTNVERARKLAIAVSLRIN
jgi:hypothetical protein